MTLMNITTKDKASAVTAEKTFFDTDCNQILDAIQSGTKEIDTAGLRIGGIIITTSAAELNYVDGVTSGIQAQIDTKGTMSDVSDDTTPTLSGSLVCDGNDVNDIGFLNFGEEEDTTIASGVITITRSFVKVGTEGGAASDDLDTIDGGSRGDLLILKSNYPGRPITVKDGTGNMRLAGGADFILSHFDDRLMAISNGTQWVELSRSDNS